MYRSKKRYLITELYFVYGRTKKQTSEIVTKKIGTREFEISSVITKKSVAASVFGTNASQNVTVTSLCPQSISYKIIIGVQESHGKNGYKESSIHVYLL